MLTINSEVNQDVTVFNLSGRLDSITVIEFENRLDQLDLANTLLLIDLSEVNFISSRGLWALIELRKAVSEVGSALVLVGLSEELGGLMDTVGFAHLFNIRETQAEGLVYLSSAILPGGPTTDAPPP